MYPTYFHADRYIPPFVVTGENSLNLGYGYVGHFRIMTSQVQKSLVCDNTVYLSVTVHDTMYGLSLLCVTMVTMFNYYYLIEIKAAYPKKVMSSTHTKC